MLTGTQILDYIETRLGRNVDEEKVLMAINEAIMEIGDMGLLYDIAEVEVDDTDQWYNMPEDYTYVEKIIYHESSTDYLYHNFTWKTGAISFDDEGKFTVVARKMPEEIELLAEPITAVHPLYHNAIKFYSLAWMKENDDFEDQTAHLLYEKFEKGVARAADTLLRSKVPTEIKVIR